jgi:type VI secretion system protein ImpM
MNVIKYSPGYFGKLPNFADFVKFNSGNNGFLLFDKWLQNGIQNSKNKLNEKFDSVYSSADMLQFIFPNQEKTGALLGTLIPSNDKSGRNYPFIISSPINNIFNNNFHLVPLVFEDFFSKTQKNVYNLKEIKTQENLLTGLENMNFSCEVNISNEIVNYEGFINSTTTHQFWNDLFGSFEDDRKYLLIYSLKEILLPLRGNQISNITLGLKIPIINNSNLYFTISLWVDICLQFIDNKNILPYLFWNINYNTNESYLVLYLNQPPFDNYLHLIDPLLLMDNICLTEKEGSIENCLPALGEKYKSLLEQKDLSLSEFIKNI